MSEASVHNSNTMTNTNTTHTTQSATRQEWIRAGLVATAFLVVAGLVAYFQNYVHWVSIDTSAVQAPQISLSAAHDGILEEVYVHVGDTVPQGAVVARVGNELVLAKISGLIVSTNLQLGTQIKPSEAIVTMIDPGALRIVGKIDEDKGLSALKVGDAAIFTVDAFGSKKFAGVVDEISPTSNQSGVVFNISDKREVKQFDIMVRYDTALYPELRNGMSARLWIHTQ